MTIFRTRGDPFGWIVLGATFSLFHRSVRHARISCDHWRFAVCGCVKLFGSRIRRGRGSLRRLVFRFVMAFGADRPICHARGWPFGHRDRFGGIDLPPSRRTSDPPWGEVSFWVTLAPSWLGWKVVPSLQMRSMITASFPAVATAACLMPFRSLSLTAQARRGEARRTFRISVNPAAQSNRRRSRSPHVLIRPDKSVSPDWYRLGVRPRKSPTSGARLKRAWSSSVAM